MYLLRVIYYWNQEGKPDEIPAGIHALDFGDTPFDDANKALNFAAEEGFCDDTAWLFAKNKEEVNLILKRDKPGIAHYIGDNYWVPSFIGEAICQSQAVKTVYINIRKYINELEQERKQPKNSLIKP